VARDAAVDLGLALMAAHLGTAFVIPEPGDDAILRRLKRSILLFDRAAVLHLSNLLNFLADGDRAPQFLVELEWLVDRGLVSPVHEGFESDYLENPFLEAARRHPASWTDALDYVGSLSYVQIHALQLSRWRREDGVMLFSRLRPNLDPIAVPNANASALASTLGIVFEAFPVPDDRTPWEQIEEFKSDPDATGHILALRRWVSKLARQGLPGTEVKQEIEWLLYEHEAHMRLHRMKTTSSTLETMITSAAEILENVAKLKFGSLAKSMFSLKRRKIQIMEAEQQAPGRELIYLSRARERFGQQVTTSK
jgi:hypothetical protein